MRFVWFKEEEFVPKFKDGIKIVILMVKDGEMGEFNLLYNINLKESFIAKKITKIKNLGIQKLHNINRFDFFFLPSYDWLT